MARRNRRREDEKKKRDTRYTRIQFVIALLLPRYGREAEQSSLINMYDKYYAELKKVRVSDTIDRYNLAIATRIGEAIRFNCGDLKRVHTLNYAMRSSLSLFFFQK